MEQDGQRLTLGIESAIGGGSISLFSVWDEIDSLTGNSRISRAEDLLLNVDRLLIRNGHSRASLRQIAVSTGPGSFTGIKIGIATALGLTDGLNCLCVGVTLLEAIALTAGNEGNVLSAVPIGRDFVCVQRFLKTQDTINPISPAELITEGQLEHDLKSVSGSAILSGHLFERIAIPKTIDVYNAGTNLAASVAKASLQGYGSDSVSPLFIDRKVPTFTG